MTMEHGVLLTSGQLADLRRTMREQWVLSVYLSHPSANPAERGMSRVQLAEAFDTLRNGIADHDGEERIAFERCVAQIGDVLTGGDGLDLSSSWVAFVTVGGIRFASEVPAPMPTLARWRRGIWVAPYMRALKQWRPITLVLVDSVSARIYRYAEGELTIRTRFDVHISEGHTDRLGAATLPHFHRGTRGATAGDLRSVARVPACGHIARRVSDHLLRTGGGTGLILGGDEAVIHAVLRALPESIGGRALLLPGVEMHTPGDTLRDLASHGASTLRNAEDERLITELSEAVGAHGRGVAGREAVVDAVRTGRAQQVLLSLRFLDAEAQAAEEIVEAALGHAVDVEVVSGQAANRLEHDGGGAMAYLRYPPIAASAMAEVG